jgi:hypothetical protein
MEHHKPRIKPYDTNQVNWQTILNLNIIIPMNQRQYEWSNNELEKFLDDLFSIFEEEKYVEKMGSIILYTGNVGNKEIYDGQQRTITTILILIVLSKKYTILKHAIENLLTVDNLLSSFTKDQQSVVDYYTEKYKVENIKVPKIFCINPFDQEAIVTILNDLYLSYYQFNKNIDCDSNDEDSDHIDEKEYCCSKCDTKITRTDRFIRHLIHVCKINNIIQTPFSSSKVYNAFNYIYSRINQWNQSETVVKKFFSFIINDIDIQKYESYDPIYVSKIFDWENNRGIPVTDLDIVKNLILTNIPNDKKYECYDKWCDYKGRTNETYTNYGEKILNVAINIYNKKIERNIDITKSFLPIINHQDVYKELLKFFKIVESCFYTIEYVKKHRFGRLLLKSKRICLPWDIFMFLIIPLFSHYSNVLQKNESETIFNTIIELCVKWYFRNIGINTRTFNNYCYSNIFCTICNSVFENKDSINSLDLFKKCLTDNIDNSIKTPEQYIQTVSNMSFKHTTATYLLYFLETSETSDNHIVCLSNTLEHIIPQKNKNTLKNQMLIDTIGNLTILEGSNSKNGHKGNSSIKDKIYSEKKKSYELSCVKLTKDIVKKYSSFNEESILSRTKEIVNKLQTYTNYL